MTQIQHVPVLLKEVVAWLDPKSNENFIDATFGLGGHSRALLEKNGPKGKVLAIEADRLLIENFNDRLILANDNFSNLAAIVARNRFGPISGILMDLGISSWHLENAKRGFSFLKDEPLDMRVGNNELTAEYIVNNWPETELEKVLREYGEEKFAGRIAENICRARKTKVIKTTFQLAEIIKRSVPANYENRRINPATRTFLALRIAVNQELENLEKALPQAIEILKKNGRLAVIAFNSLEDRIVKNFLKNKADEGAIEILTKKPVMASPQEIITNPRSRSAKLRVALKK